VTDGRSARAEAQRHERRREILDAAQRVFAERGYHGTSISDLVDAAGIARGTFYRYFDSKQQIFAELLDRLLTDFRDSVVGVDTRPGAPPIHEQLVATVHRVFHAARSHRTVARLIFREAMAVDEAFDERVLAFETRLHAYLRQSLDNGIAMGLLRPHDTDIAASCVYGSIRQLIYRLTASDPPAEDDQLHDAASEVVTFALRGVLTA
jgi:AcrR family transcriptional regulator